MHEPLAVEVASTHDDTSIHQHFYRVWEKTPAWRPLQRLFLGQRPESSVVFCDTKHESQQVAEALNAVGLFRAGAEWRP